MNESNKMEKLCDTPYNHFDRAHSICETPNGFALTGGFGSSLCVVYNTWTKSWRRMSDMLSERDCHASISVKGTLLVIGGCIPHPDTKIPLSSHSVHVLSLGKGAWEQGPRLPFPMKLSKVTELGGNVYLMDQKSHSLLHLDMESQLWRSKTSFPLNEYIAGVSMTSAYGRLYVAGGFTNVCAFYRPATDTWCFAQPPLYKHHYGTLVHFNNKLVLLGGEFGYGSDTVEEYNFEEGSWTACSFKMPAHLSNHFGMVLPSF